jgi:hypothetical protein
MRSNFVLVKRLLPKYKLLLAFIAASAVAYDPARLVPFSCQEAEAVSPIQEAEQAGSAFDFVNSVGVNTHLNYFDRTYGNFGLVERELQSAGIRHLRDGVHLQNADYNSILYGRWAELGKLGIRFDAVLDPRSKLGALTPSMLEQIEQLSGGTIESFEGPNELDISGLANWVDLDRSYQSTIFAAVRALPDAEHIRVIGPSMAMAAHGEAFRGGLSGCDEGNLHPYPAGKIPSAVFPGQIDLAREIFGDKPIVITETGYHNALSDHSDQPAVSERAAAKYIPRLFLENFTRGVSRTYLYELFDEAADPGLSNNQMHWGLIRADGTEKPAFASLKRMIAELNDSTEPRSLAQFSWSLSKADAQVHHLLLEKSNGEVDLVLWNEVPSYNLRTQKDIANPPLETTLHLAKAAARVTVYEPVRQDAPVGTYVNTAALPLAIPDAPVVVEIDLK